MLVFLFKCCAILCFIVEVKYCHIITSGVVALTLCLYVITFNVLSKKLLAPLSLRSLLEDHLSRETQISHSESGNAENPWQIVQQRNCSHSYSSRINMDKRGGMACGGVRQGFSRRMVFFSAPVAKSFVWL